MHHRLAHICKIALSAVTAVLTPSSIHGQDIVPAAIRPTEPAEIQPSDFGSAEMMSHREISAVERRFQYAFRLGLRGVRDDNIFLTQDGQVGDYYLAIEPGITLGFGDIVGSDQNYVRLDYAPSAIVYADHSSANALQHVIALRGAYHFRRLTITLSEDIELLEGANVNSISSTAPNPVPAVRLDAGGAVGVNSYSTNGIFAYDLTGKTFLSGGVQHIAYDYDASLISSETLSGNLFVNFTFSPKLTVGLGGTFGYNWVDDPSPDQSFEQINARLTYQATGKVTFNGSVGVEFRQFSGNGQSGSYASPVYELGATYQPFDGTSITLSGNRRTQNSAVLAGQDYSTTDINVTVRQRFLRRVYLGLAVGYENASYFSTINGLDASREDNYFFMQPAIDVTLTRYSTLGVYYLHRENNSSSFFGFDDNQFGLRTSLTF